MSIQQKINERKCSYFGYVIMSDGDLSKDKKTCIQSNEFRIDNMWCDNCKANHEARQIQEIIHERIKRVSDEHKERYGGYETIIDRKGLNCSIENGGYICDLCPILLELKDICGCKECLGSGLNE